jgi:predicted nucleic acid-binding protein
LGGRIAASDAETVLDGWERLAIDRVAHAPLVRRIWELREDLTASDAAFVAVAEVHGVALLTADRRLATAPGPRCAIELFPL